MSDPHENIGLGAAAQRALGRHEARPLKLDRKRPSRLVLLHGALFSVGVATLLVGWTIAAPSLLLVSGPCLSLSGLLIWVGSRITFAGPLGAALRAALGRTRVFTLHLRAVIWLLLGILITAWGIHGLLDARDREPPLLRQPLATNVGAR
jgi:hypothetical protein